VFEVSQGRRRRRQQLAQVVDGQRFDRLGQRRAVAAPDQRDEDLGVDRGQPAGPQHLEPPRLGVRRHRRSNQDRHRGVDLMREGVDREGRQALELEARSDALAGGEQGLPATQLGVLVEQPTILQAAVDLEHQGFGIDRFDQVVERPRAQGAHRGLRRADAREHDHVELRPSPFGLVEQFETVHLRHEEIGQQKVEVPLCQPVEGLPPVCRHDDLVAGSCERVSEDRPHQAVVVGDQDPGDRGAHRDPPARRISAGVDFSIMIPACWR
jgi:hypothetical protein